MPKTNKVSLTTFVDFVSKSGTPKITVVRQYKEQEYQPAFDFYKAAREAIVTAHKNGNVTKALEGLLASLTDPKKVEPYAAIVQGHRKFIGRRTVQWFEPPTSTWTGGGIQVQVNPELGLVLDGTPHIVKLYFKAERLPKKNVAIVTRLMEKGLSKASGSATFAVLDVRRGLLHAQVGAGPGLDALLLGEAMSFASILASL